MKKSTKELVLALLVVILFGLIGYLFLGYPPPSDSKTEQSDDVKAHIYTPNEMLADINKLRSEKGVPPLRLDDRLNQTADMVAQEMVKDEYYDHVNPKTGHRNGLYIYDYMGRECQFANENINNVYSDTNPVTDKVEGWVTSEGHNHQQLNPRYDKIGFSSVIVNKTVKNSYETGDVLYVAHFCDVL